MNDQSKSASDDSSALSAASGLLDLGFLSKAEATDGLVSLPQQAGDFIGRYRLVAPLGEGGFGLVWQAEQTEPIHRELALKLIKPGVDSREIIARFEAERQALALMDHPNIAAVLDAGTTADGRPYFAMELVKGEPITTYCDRHRLGIDKRLALFIPVCRAVQHAHQKAILHRDLKPSNILVATVDGQPVPKVIDFGIAKALVGNESLRLADMVRTQMGVAIGTPRYMSPEQAGSRPDVDTRSDIYSLGIVLCELLTGQSPHPAQPAEFLDALRWIRESDPVKPSTLAQRATAATGEAAERRGMDARHLTRRLKGDLDWITIKALEKDRTLRYESATALARDLERHLAAEPVSAAAPTWRYQFGKFAHRRRGALIAASLVAAALVAGSVISLWQAFEAKKSRQEAEHRYGQARDAVDKFLVRVTGNPKLNQSDFVDLQRQLLETAMPFYEDLSRYRGDDPKLRSDRAWASGNLADIFQRLGELDKAEAGYRQTIDDLAKLVVQLPEDLDQQYHLGQRQDGLGQLLSGRGKQDESLAAFNEAVKTMETLGSRAGENPNYEYTRAGAYNNRAVILVEMGHYQAASESLKVAITIGEKLVKHYPEVGNYWMVLATAASTEAHQLHTQQRYVEEVSERRRAVEFFDVVAKSTEDKRNYPEIIAFNRGLLGNALNSANLPEEAEPVLRRAVGELQALVNQVPSFGGFRRNLLNNQKELSKSLRSQGKDAEADAVLEQIRTQTAASSGGTPKASTQAQEAEPGGAVTRPREADPLRPAVAELSAGNYAHAVKLAQEFAGLNPTGWQGMVAAAEVMAGALPLIRSDNRLDAAARDKLAGDCSTQAVDFLKQAMAEGYTGMAYFNTLPSAKSLQPRPDYQALLASPVSPPAHSPTKFTFDYPHSDPGPRHWMRDGVTWTETQPSGIKNIYTIAGPFVLNGMPGAILRRMSATSQAAFVPDLDAGKTSSLWLRGADGAWGRLGTTKDVE